MKKLQRIKQQATEALGRSVDKGGEELLRPVRRLSILQAGRRGRSQ